MPRLGSLPALATVSLLLAPAASQAQATGHDHHITPVDCSTLASPPWNGLTDMDRGRFEAARQSVMAYSTPEAAIAAGFHPELGDIPGMGVHYVHSARSRDGIAVDAPDHLMFAPVDGEETLVGAAYAFVGVPETTEPIPYDSDLATWHDHPQFAPEGQTLHMLHVWFVPSSNGPFAGLNFWLPYEGAGLTPPSSCWMADDDVAMAIQQVAFALVPADNPIALDIAEARGWTGEEEVSPQREEILRALDAAAQATDRDAWVAAAHRFLGDLSEREQFRMSALLRILTDAQMSSAQRGDPGGQ